MLGNQISLTNNVAKQVISVIATTNGQQDFTVEGGYRINQLGVYRNGVRLVDGRDFTARDGATVRLVSQGAFAGDAMEFVVFDDFRVADALSVNSGGTVNASVNITGALQLGTGTSIFSPADNTLTFGTNNSERVRITSTGNIGIGTDNPSTKLEVAGTGSPTFRISDLDGTNQFGQIFANNGTFVIESRNDASDGQIIFRGRDNTDTNEYARFDENGKLGIGTDNPDSIFHIESSVPRLTLSDTGTNAHHRINADSSVGNFGFDVDYDSATSTPAFFVTIKGNEKVRISADGNVGINESDPLAKLHIDGSADAPCLILPDSTNSRFSTGFGNINVSGVGQRLDFYAGDSGSNTANLTSTHRRMSLTATGRLGVGTISPPARVSGVIESNTTKYFPPDYSENWAGAFINEEDGATYNGVLIANRWRGTESIVLKVGSLFNSSPEFDPYFVIDGVGKVGIGTDVPESNVHIVSSAGINPTAPSKPGIHMGEGGTDDYHVHICAVNGTANAYIDFSEPSVDYRARIIKTMGGGFAFIQEENQVMQFRTSGLTRMQISGSGNVQVVGALSKGSGSFKIDHPLVGMSTTHNLVHSFIEGPQADLIYRGKVDLVGGSATVNIDTAGRMTEGTFDALCTNVQCFTSNETDWTAVKGSISGNILTITAQDNTSTATVSWMVVGERKDQHMIDTEWTDENGRVITEPLKEIISDV